MFTASDNLIGAGEDRARGTQNFDQTKDLHVHITGERERRNIDSKRPKPKG